MRSKVLKWLVASNILSWRWVLSTVADSVSGSTLLGSGFAVGAIFCSVPTVDSAFSVLSRYFLQAMLISTTVYHQLQILATQ